MSMSEAEWIERAQSWEAKHNTLKQSLEATLERVKEFKANFGVKERSDGAIEIDYDKFVERLGLEGWLALREIGDQHWQVSGQVGQKPRVRVAAA